MCIQIDLFLQGKTSIEEDIQSQSLTSITSIPMHTYDPAPACGKWEYVCTHVEKTPGTLEAVITGVCDPSKETVGYEFSSRLSSKHS